MPQGQHTGDGIVAADLPQVFDRFLPRR